MALSTGAAVVFALTAVALVFFVTELLPPDITAVAVLVSLAVLEPVTGVDTATAIGGFASPAVVTIVGMYVLSAGVERAGVVSWIGYHLGRATRGSPTRLLGATLGATGLSAGLVNNTPVVAVFIPMISDLADEAGISPSKFLMPLSFAAMLGGSLTLVGSSINLVAADVAAQTLGRRISMFEFTPLGLLVFLAGFAYLMTVGRWLTPERIEPAGSLTDAYDLGSHLARVRVREGSPLVGETATDLFVAADLDLDVSVLQVERTREERSDQDGEPVVRTTTETFSAAAARPIEAGDVLTVRGNTQEINRFATAHELRQLPRETVTDADLEADHPGMLAEVVIPGGSWLIGETPTTAELRRRFDTLVLAVRRGDETVREGVADRPIREGDTLLLRTTESTLDFLREESAALLVQEASEPAELPRFEPDPPSLDVRAPLSVAILVAAVVLLLPVAVQTAAELGLDGFSVLLATFFGASAAYVTPIGYQTNLMVYGPGGYRFTDYLRVGLPMQLFLSLVTTAGLLVLFPP